MRSIVVELLSCIAMESQIYLAVNLARETQVSQHYNTDIVFNRFSKATLSLSVRNLFLAWRNTLKGFPDSVCLERER